jgi:hypothetical protein
MSDTNKVIHSIDTIYNKIFVYDTIYTKTEVHFSDTIKPELINIYDKLIVAQDDKFDYLLVGIGITVTALIILVSVMNIFLSKELFKLDAKKIFKREKKKLEIDLDKKFLRLEKLNDYNLHQAVAIDFLAINQNKGYVPAVKNMLAGLKIVIEIKENKEIISTVRVLESTMQNVIDKKIKGKLDIKESKKIIDLLPSDLNFESSKIKLHKQIDEIQKNQEE